MSLNEGLERALQADPEPKTMAKLLRPHAARLQAWIDSGVPVSDVVARLAAEGIEVKPRNLVQILYRIRKRDSATVAMLTAEQTRARSAIAAPDGHTEPAVTDSDRFEAALDPKKRAAKADRYLNVNRPVIGRTAKGEVE